jgi:hypothetical protein
MSGRSVIRANTPGSKASRIMRARAHHACDFRERIEGHKNGPSNPGCPSRGRNLRLQDAEECHQILLLLWRELVTKDQVEEFNCIVQRQQTPVM